MSNSVGWQLLSLVLSFSGYLAFMYWLSNVARKDMERRGQPGWVFGSFIFWSTLIGLLTWLEARRRYPILDKRIGREEGAFLPVRVLRR